MAVCFACRAAFQILDPGLDLPRDPINRPIRRYLGWKILGSIENPSVAFSGLSKKREQGLHWCSGASRILQIT